MTNHPPLRFPEYDPSKESLPAASTKLLHEQRHSWPRLREGYESLDRIQTRLVHCRGFDVTLQFNPARIVSTAARVDATSISKRPCFLCQKNLPAEQKGVLVDGEFLVLCNPAPIFSQHFTVSHLTHRPQAIEDSLPRFLSLTRTFSPEFSVFYNGPRCGASAPDHLHFQVSPRGAIPIEHEAIRPERRGQTRPGNVVVLPLINLGRRVVLIEGGDRQAVEAVMSSLFRSMRAGGTTDEEPMVNIIASFVEERWRLILFPRAKHRPAKYFAEGESRVTVSPAAVDMGGLIVTPVERDFRTLDAATIESIFEEVTVPEADLHQLLKSIP